MSKHTRRKKKSARVAPVRKPVSQRNMRRKWGALEIGEDTRKHLEQLLVEDAEVAFAATMALMLEYEKEERSLLHSLLKWAEEEVRLVILEEGSVQISEFARTSLDAGIAVRFFDLSFGLVLPSVLLITFLAVLFIVALYHSEVRRVKGLLRRVTLLLSSSSLSKKE